MQSDDDRTQSQTQAALPKSGSLLPVYDVQPHDQIVEKCSSCATCFAASACHFTTSNHACAGSSPARPPFDALDWKPSITPRRLGGMPIARKRPTEARMLSRIVRLPTTGPSAWIRLSLK